MKKINVLNVVWVLFLFLSFIMFTIQIFQPTEKVLTKCYDKYGSEIINQICYKDVPNTHLFGILAVISMILFFVFLQLWDKVDRQEFYKELYKKKEVKE